MLLSGRVCSSMHEALDETTTTLPPSAEKKATETQSDYSGIWCCRFFLKESGDSNAPAIREIDVLGGQEERITILLCWPPLSLLQ